MGDQTYGMIMNGGMARENGIGGFRSAMAGMPSAVAIDQPINTCDVALPLSSGAVIKATTAAACGVNSAADSTVTMRRASKAWASGARARLYCAQNA